MWPFFVGQDFTQENSLFGAVKSITKADTAKYNYSGYGIGFDVRFSLSDGSGFGKNIIFGADMSSSAHIEEF